MDVAPKCAALFTKRLDDIIVETFEGACWLNAFFSKNKQLVWGHLKNTKMIVFTIGLKMRKRLTNGTAACKGKTRLMHSPQWNCVEKQVRMVALLDLIHGCEPWT